MQNYKIDSDFMENLLDKIKQESKRITLAGYFYLLNTHLFLLIKYAQKTGVSQLLETVLSNNFVS